MSTSIDPQEFAARLRTAETDGVPIPPISPEVGAGDIDAAYAIQAASLAAWRAAGRRLVGRKIGLTNPAVQRQLGVDQPDFGALLDDMSFPTGAEVPYRRVLQPRIEAEMAFVLQADLPDPDVEPDQVAAAVAYVSPALEIVGSRIADWKIAIVDTIADNASSGAFVIGEARLPLAEVDLTGATMSLSRRRGGHEEVVSQGTGAACLGSPLLAATWLAAEMARRGEPLRAGDLVLTGALGPMVPVEPGDRYAAMITGLGEVEARFSTT